MRSKCLPLVVLMGLLLPLLACGETDFLDQIKTRKLPQSALREHVLSLDESAVLKLANEAFEKGWDPYAVSEGILGPYCEAKKLVFTTEKKLAILKDSKMHPDFREEVASWGLRDRSMDVDSFFKFADEVLSFFEDETVEYFHKQGIPEWLREALQRKADDIRKEPGDEGHKSQALDKLHARGIRVMSALVTCLEKNPRPSKDRVDYSASSFAVASLSKYVGWYLDEAVWRTEDAEKRLAGVRKAQRALVSILENTEYDPTAARMVLRCSEESNLKQVLSAETVARIKKDGRFSSDEDQGLLDALSQRAGSRAGE